MAGKPTAIPIDDLLTEVRAQTSVGLGCQTLMDNLWNMHQSNEEGFDLALKELKRKPEILAQALVANTPYQAMQQKPAGA